ncbi:hypothetical protein HBI71_004920 [Parastagonospora nodorum]|nr:hypothetical protein HBI71_004920 [Parastagonospora nodorum]KAH5414430.1 hypothetical protein HBI47_153280 [Parastagonospora nodorum]
MSFDLFPCHKTVPPLHCRLGSSLSHVVHISAIARAHSRQVKVRDGRVSFKLYDITVNKH